MDLLFSVKSLFSDYLAGGKIFYIPEYQRGYKWTKSNVQVLLDDLKKFEESKPSNEQFYCLQNITIVPDSDNPKQLNVVDGQQRLTTLYILLSYLKTREGKKYSFFEDSSFEKSLEYAIRKNTAIYLQKLANNENLVWTQNIDPNGAQSKDEWYIRDVASGIIEWYKSNDLLESTIFEKLQLIVNRIEKGNEHSIFAGLNGGKVDLDGADLVRAELITRSANEKYGIVPSELQSGVSEKINEFRTRLGMELDDISRWWSDSERQKFFIQLLPDHTVDNKQFNIEDYPIDLLYQLYYECDYEVGSDKTREPLDFRFFEHGRDTNGIKRDHDHWELYESVVSLHRAMQEWYEDPKLYHWIGFLFFNFKGRRIDEESISFRHIYRQWAKWKKWNSSPENTESFLNNKSEFIVYIQKLIKAGLLKDLKPSDEKENVTEQQLKEQMLSAIIDTQQNWYDGDYSYFLGKILPLMDVMIQTGIYQYPQKGQKDIIDIKKIGKLPIDYLHHYSLEDKEHIRSCTPNDMEANDVRQKSDWISYVEKMFGSEEKMSNIENSVKTAIFEILNKCPDELSDTNINDINLLLNSIGQNSIGNLVLLHRRVNRGYRNAVFQDKVNRIVIEYMQKSNYIRPYTLLVFLGKLSSDDKEWRWNLTDIELNASNIKKQIKYFLDLV